MSKSTKSKPKSKARKTDIAPRRKGRPAPEPNLEPGDAHGRQDSPTLATSPEDATTPPAKTKAPRRKRGEKLSALDAAAKVLAGAGKPMASRAIIEAMATAGLWTSPGGKTPHATLYAAMIREIGEKGDAARFRKVERGLFAAAA